MIKNMSISINLRSLNIKRQNDTILNNFQKEIGAI